MPSDETALLEEASRAVGESVSHGLVARGTWFPNAQGLAVLKSITPSYQIGVIVVAQGRISFLQWNDTQSRFNVLRSVSYIDAKQVFLDRLGAARMLVVQGSDGAFDSFEFNRGFGMLGSPAQAEQAFAVIGAERLHR